MRPFSLLAAALLAVTSLSFVSCETLTNAANSQTGQAVLKDLQELAFKYALQFLTQLTAQRGASPAITDSRVEASIQGFVSGVVAAHPELLRADVEAKVRAGYADALNRSR